MLRLVRHGSAIRQQIDLLNRGNPLARAGIKIIQPRGQLDIGVRRQRNGPIRTGDIDLALPEAGIGIARHGLHRSRGRDCLLGEGARNEREPQKAE